MRLVNGPNSYSGRVEIFYEGAFGTICDDGWDDTDAGVVCRQLGYSGGTAVSEAGYGEGTGPIVLDDLVCSGAESGIEDCGHSGWTSHNCGHYEDAGVTCGKLYCAICVVRILSVSYPMFKLVPNVIVLIILIMYHFIDYNECQDDNGGCDTTCIDTVGSYRCGCNVGFQINADERNCDGKI